MNSAALAALDRWIAEQAQRIPPVVLTREQAKELLAVEYLKTMGLLKTNA